MHACPCRQECLHRVRIPLLTRPVQGRIPNITGRTQRTGQRINQQRAVSPMYIAYVQVRGIKQRHKKKGPRFVRLPPFPFPLFLLDPATKGHFSLLISSLTRTGPSCRYVLPPPATSPRPRCHPVSRPSGGLRTAGQPSTSVRNSEQTPAVWLPRERERERGVAGVGVGVCLVSKKKSRNQKGEKMK